MDGVPLRWPGVTPRQEPGAGGTSSAHQPIGARRTRPTHVCFVSGHNTRVAQQPRGGYPEAQNTMEGSGVRTGPRLLRKWDHAYTVPALAGRSRVGLERRATGSSGRHPRGNVGRLARCTSKYSADNCRARGTCGSSLPWPTGIPPQKDSKGAPSRPHNDQ